MSYPLSAELRKRFARTGPLQWLARPAVDKELNRLVERMAADKSQETGQTFTFDGNRDGAVLLTDCYGTPIAAATIMAGYFRWGYVNPEVRGQRDWLAVLVDLIQAQVPALGSFGEDPELTGVLHNFKLFNPERLPQKEDAS